MKKIYFKLLGTFILLFISCQISFAGWFFEHKYIGDIAFKRFVVKHKLENFFRESLQFKQFGDPGVDIPFKRPDIINYYKGMFVAISDNTSYYSYGDMSGLAGDHSVDFIQLYRGLFKAGELMNNIENGNVFGELTPDIQKALASHRIGIDQYKNQGEYSSIAYLEIAWEDQSHFQRPPESFEDMLNMIKPELIKVADSLFTLNPSKIKSTKKTNKTVRTKFDNDLLNLNNTAKYAIMHLVAIEVMKNAGVLYKLGDKNYKKLVEIAFLINAFADHFLQDSFAGGHIPVKRGKWNGLDNNGVHDFYCRVGVDVHSVYDKKGWRTYGDNFYAYSDSVTYKHAIEADIVSLEELWNWFDSGQTQGPSLRTPYSYLAYGSISYDTVPRYLRSNFKAYNYMPIPLDSATYKSQIKLKNGSKNGAYYEASFMALNTLHNNEDIRSNYLLHAGVGIGYCYKKLTPNCKGLEKPFAKKTESIIWLGLSANYFNLVLGAERENWYYFGGSISYKDRLTFDQSLIGGSFSPYEKSFIEYSAIGLELKYLTCRLAPSIKYFFEAQASRPPVNGLALSFRLY